MRTFHGEMSWARRGLIHPVNVAQKLALATLQPSLWVVGTGALAGTCGVSATPEVLGTCSLLVGVWMARQSSHQPLSMMLPVIYGSKGGFFDVRLNAAIGHT